MKAKCDVCHEEYELMGSNGRGHCNACNILGQQYAAKMAYELAQFNKGYKMKCDMCGKTDPRELSLRGFWCWDCNRAIEIKKRACENPKTCSFRDCGEPAYNGMFGGYFCQGHGAIIKGQTQ